MRMSMSIDPWSENGESLTSIVSAPTKVIAYATGIDETARSIDKVSSSADRIAPMWNGEHSNAKPGSEQ